MYTSKKLKRKLGMAMASLALLGGFSITATAGFVSQAEATSIAGDIPFEKDLPKYDTQNDPSYIPIKEPTNVLTITLSPENKAMLSSNFPIGKIGTTKAFSSKKSSGTIKYEKEGITLIERVSRSNPQFTYLKKLPKGVTLNDIKGLEHKDAVGFGTYGGVDFVMTDASSSDLYQKYNLPKSYNFDVMYTNKKISTVTIWFPNETYNQEKIRLNESLRASKDSSLEKAAKKEYILPEAYLKDLGAELPLQPIGTIRKFSNDNSYGYIEYTEDGIKITEVARSRENPKYTYLTGVEDKIWDKAPWGEMMGVQESCQSGISTYEYKIEYHGILASTTIPYASKTVDSNVSALRKELASIDEELVAVRNEARKLDVSLSVSGTNKRNWNDGVVNYTAEKNTLDKKMKTLQAKKVNLDKQIKPFQTKKTTLDNKLKTLQAQQATVNNDIKAKQTQQTTLNNKLKTLQAQKATAKTVAQKNAIQKQIASVQAQQKTMKTQLTSLNTKKANLQKQVVSVQAQQKTNNSKLTSLNNQKAANTKEITAVQDKLKAVNAELAGYNAKIEAEQDKAISIQKQRADLMRKEANLVLKKATLQMQLHELGK